MTRKAAPSLPSELNPPTALKLPSAELMFIGGPGGPLLDKMIEAMGAKPEQVYIAPVLKLSEELNEYIEAVKPKVVVALGDDVSFQHPRGSIQSFSGTKWITTFHPNDLIQNPSAKKEAWEHLKLAMKELGWKPKASK